MIRVFGLAALAALVGAGPAAADAEGRYRGFTGVEAQGQFRVEVAAGAPYGVRMEGDDVGQARVSVRDGVLRIEHPDGGGEPALDLVVYVSAPRIDRLKATRGAVLDAGTLTAGALELEASTGAQLSVAGSCTALAARATLGGVLRAEGLVCARVAARASFGGVIAAHADDALEASAFMGGDIDVAGAPPHSAERTSWGGDIAVR